MGIFSFSPSLFFTWQDVEDEARRRGVNLEQRSTADRRLLQTDPDKAMRAVGIWAGWDAASPEQQALDHQWMEDWRKSAGYSGGSLGMDWQPLDSSADGRGAGLGSFDFNDPAGTAAFSGKIYGGTRPQYDGGGESSQAMLDAVLGYGDFSYDPAKDPLYGSYKKTYTREGQRAGADALAQAAAMTGGIPSSYAVGAANQAGNYYAAQLADRIPALEALAYQRWADGYDRALTDYRAAADADDRAYGRYLDALAQYNADRAFDYGAYGDEFDRARQAAALGDFSRLDELGYDTSSARGTLYAYGDDGSSYSVGSHKGQFFLAYAPAGSTMTGGDGSTWTKNADGSVTITAADGKTYRYGGTDEAAAGYSGAGYGGGGGDPAADNTGNEPLGVGGDYAQTISDLIMRGATMTDINEFINGFSLSDEEKRALRRWAAKAKNS